MRCSDGSWVPRPLILVFVAAGDLQKALALQERERMAYRAAAPVAHLGSKSGREAQAVVGAREPDEVSCPESKPTASDESAEGSGDVRKSDMGEPPEGGRSTH